METNNKQKKKIAYKKHTKQQMKMCEHFDVS